MDQLTQVIRILKTPVTLIALLALLFGAGYWGYKAVTTDTVAAANRCVMTDVGGELTPKSVQVRTLNAGGKALLAKQTANDLRPYGFTVVRVNNSDRVVDKTVVIGNAVDDPEVKLVMQFFPNSIAEGDGRADHIVDVLVGTAFVRTPNGPVTTLKVSGPVCLPPPLTGAASASASASAASTPSPTAKKS